MRGRGLSIGLRALAIFVVTLLVTSAWAATNWNEKVLHSFGSGADGWDPWVGLISDAAGNLYGTTLYGGTYNYGTVFELSHSEGGGWTETVLHSFNNNGTDGWYPTAGSLTLDAAGNLYGTTQYGPGYGSVFEMSPMVGGGWTEEVVYNFDRTVGANPKGPLIFDAAGNLYGTADYGGAYCDLFGGCGTVFELTPIQGGGWTAKALHSFGNGTDGSYPLAGVIFDTAGNLYGTTTAGGIYGHGTVFVLTPTQGGGWTETVLYSFGPAPDGVEPWAGLTFDAAGNLYGTTRLGGIYGFSGAGTVFKLTPEGSGSWTETVLHSFGNGMDGALPLFVSLIFDAAGNLYGTTEGGGIYGGGTVFEFTPNGSGGWTETLLHSFPNNRTDGYLPYAGLIFDAAGNLYGTTNEGGTYQKGTVFELTPVYPCIKCSHAVLQ